MERPWLVKKMQGLGTQTFRCSLPMIGMAAHNFYRGNPKVGQWFLAAGIAMIPLAFVLAALEYCCQRLETISPLSTTTEN